MIKKLLLLVSLLSITISSAQFYEGFENEAFPPPGWTVLSTGAGGAEVWERYTNFVNPVMYIGNGGAYIDRENIGMGNTEEDWLITPQLAVGENSVLSFFTRTSQYGNQGTYFQIRVATEADPENYVPIQTWTDEDLLLAFNAISLKSVPLDDYAGQNIYVAFVRVFTQSSQAISGDRWIVDEVSVNANVTGGSQPFNTISGALSYDQNGTCTTPTIISPAWVNFAVTGSGLDLDIAGGSFQFNSIELNQDITITPTISNSLFTVQPPQVVHNFADYGNLENTLFCISPLGYHPNLEVHLIPITDARPGEDAKYKLIYRNLGNQVHTGSVTLTFDDARLDFVSGTPAPDATATNTLTWNFTDLQPLSMGQAEFWLNVNSPMETPPVNIDDVLSFTASVTSQHPDEVPANDQATLEQVVIGSLDPNDKIVLEGSSISESQIGNYLNYVVRFQNVGTAPAETVVVRDMIENDLDLATYEVVGASHAFTQRREGAMVEFVFDDINLADATTDEPNSHGFVAFRIKPKNTSTVGTTFSNKANIYFDFNYPIETNLVETTVTQLSTPVVERFRFALHPNPAKTSFSISSSQIPMSVSILNALGQRVKIFSGDLESFDVSDLNRGIYFVEVLTSEGRMVEKLLKE